MWTAMQWADELSTLALEAENMALTLESLGYGPDGKLCTPLARYRKLSSENAQSLAQMPAPKDSDS